MSDTSQQPVYSVVGDRYTILLSGAETGGAYSVIEMYVPAGNGSPPHVHQREDEGFYVVEGEFEFQVAGKLTRVRAGEFLFGRRDVPHHFTNVGSAPGIIILTATPAGLENFFAEIGRRLPDRQTAPAPATQEDIAHLIETAPKYGIELLV